MRSIAQLKIDNLKTYDLRILLNTKVITGT